MTVLAWALFVLLAAVALVLPRSRTGGPLVTAVLLPVTGAATFGSALAERSGAGRVVDVAANVLIAVLIPAVHRPVPGRAMAPPLVPVGLAAPGRGDRDVAGRVGRDVPGAG